MNLEDISKELESIDKQLGGNKIIIPENYELVSEVISTGSIGIDFKSGIGGLPVGKIVSIVGNPSTGKSTICLQLCANANKDDQLAVYIDGEHEINLKYAQGLGVDLDKFLIVQPDTMEEGLELLEKFFELNKFKIIIFDSIAALPTKKEMEAGLEDLQTGDKAKLMSKHLRRIANLVNKSNTLVVYINQYRDNISFGYGSGKTVPGGHAMRYRAAMEIELVTVTAQVKVGDEPIGSRVRAKFVKNKLARPYTEWEFTIVWGQGIVEEYDLIEIAVQSGIIDKKGAWFSYNDINIGQGVWKTMEYLKNNPELKNEIKNKVYEMLAM